MFVMQIEELVEFAELFDVYGKLLSKKQYEIMSEYLNFNLGESELAEMFGGTRQSVHDAITKAKKQLLDFEDKCHILKGVSQTKQKLIKLKKITKDNIEAQNLINDIADNL